MSIRGRILQIQRKFVQLHNKNTMKWGLGACTPRRRRRGKKSLGQPAGSGELVQLGVPSILPNQRCVAVLLLAREACSPTLKV